MRYEITDRYSATGTPYPDPKTMCMGQCDGMGFYPHKSAYQYMFVEVPNEEEAIEQLRWDEQHKRSLWKTLGLHLFTCDGWHFIKCPVCNGSRTKLQQHHY